MIKRLTIKHKEDCSRKGKGLSCGKKDGKCPECGAPETCEPVNELDLCPICGALFPRDGSFSWK